MFSVVLANGQEQMFDRASDLYAWSVKNKPEWFPETWAKSDNVSKRKAKRRHFGKDNPKRK